jgi:hypothetical protein
VSVDGGDDEAGAVAEAGVRIGFRRSMTTAPTLRLISYNGRPEWLREFGIQELNGVVRSRVATWGNGVGAEKNVPSPGMPRRTRLFISISGLAAQSLAYHSERLAKALWTGPAVFCGIPLSGCLRADT